MAKQGLPNGHGHCALKNQQASAQTDATPICRIEDPQDQNPTAEHAFHKWPNETGRYQPSFYRLSNGFLIRFAGVADFVVSQTAHEITTKPVQGIPREVIDDVYRNLVLPLALSQQQQLVFHASAIEINQSSVIFVASSGTGKSTLAASFTTNGNRFLADDYVWLKKQSSGFHVWPGDPTMRIWQDTFEALDVPAAYIAATKNSIGKWQLGSSRADTSSQFHCGAPRPLKHVYFLETNPTGKIQMESITTQEAVVGLLSHRFLLDVTNKTVLKTNIEEISKLATATPCFQLSIPNNFDALSDIRSRVIAHTNGKSIRELTDSPIV